ncbi:MAG: DUF368 domain-containing protein [Alkaliphilus sp.]|nr:DUF368 domain-containing protein [Alkaliphilus sp.]
MRSIIQGLILGLIIVLPGMSGGTVFVIFGIYEDLVRDLVRFKIRPYIPLIGGMVVGIFIGGMAFALFFEAYRDITVAFLLGGLLASIKSVIKDSPGLTMNKVISMVFGIAFGYYMVSEPMTIDINNDVEWYLLVVGGALSTAAMIIPGVPGSSVLIIMGIYGSVLSYIRELNFVKLTIFGIGCIAGAILLLNILEKIYDKHRDLLSYCFAGLILGSTRALLPHTFSLSILLIFTVGFASVWVWSGKGVEI